MNNNAMRLLQTIGFLLILGSIFNYYIFQPTSKTMPFLEVLIWVVFGFLMIFVGEVCTCIKNGV